MDSSGKGGMGGSSSARFVFDTVFIMGIGSIVGGLSIGCRAKVRGVVRLLLGEALANFSPGKAFSGE